jgi:hypothetical protein
MATYLRKTGALRSSASLAVSAEGDIVGFPPKRVEIVNQTNGARFLWFESMNPDEGLKIAAAGTATYLAADGLTPKTTGFELAAGIVDINDTDDELLLYHVTG